MDKCCRNCKWYFKSQCNCPDLISNILLENNYNGTTYVEDGLLSKAIEEEVNFSDIKDLIVDKLYEEGYIKKNRNINKFDIEDIENGLIEIIDDGLSRSIMNYFDNGINNGSINFNNIDEYHCCYWE
jgi:hypothetical protein